YTPGPRETIEQVAAARSFLLAAIYRNVQGSAVAFRFDGAGWHQTVPLPLPDKAALSLVSTSERAEQAFIDVAGYLLPNTLYLADLAAGTAEPVKTLPPRSDASDADVEQFEAASPDGTPVP